MKDHLWPREVSGRLHALLTDSFAGVQFQAYPLSGYDSTTIDVAWTDGPPLHEVDVVALEFVLGLEINMWGTIPGDGPRIDRISKRRSMSQAAEAVLMRKLAASLKTAEEELDHERMYPFPSVLVSSQDRIVEGMIPEFLDLLFEATSFNGAEGLGVCAPAQSSSLLCRCDLCG